MPKSKPSLTRAQREHRVNLAKLQKIFSIMGLLKTGRWTIKQLAERADVSLSTMYRYLALLEDSGFYIEKDFHDRHFIAATEDDPMPDAFSAEETSMLCSLVKADTNHPLKSSILKKLSRHSEIDVMPRLFLKARLGNFVEQLTHAMRDKHQVILKNYHSANSNDLRDRLIEPIHFTDDYGTINALDLDNKICKQFKLDRIGEIVETHKTFAHQHLHELRSSDVFGLAGTPTATVTLNLTLRAFLLLREEFPTAQAHLTTNNNTYTFHAPVVSFTGVGRFVLGLLDEIEIVAPDDLRVYLEEKVGRRFRIVV